MPGGRTDKVTELADEGEVSITPPGQPQPEIPEPKEPPMNDNSKKPIDGVPYDIIRDLMGTHGQMTVRINRQAANGKFSSIGPSITMTPTELTQVDEFLTKFAGGGIYEVVARSVPDPTHVLVRFLVRLEGPPKAFVQEMEHHQRMTSDPNAPRQVGPLPPPPIGSDAWQESVANDAGGRMPVGFGGAVEARPFRDPYGGRERSGTGSYNERPAPGAAYASDELAVDQLRAMQRQFTELQRNYAQLYARGEEERKRAEAETHAAKLRAQEMEFITRQKTLESEMRREMELLKLRLETGGGNKGTDVVGLITALSPIVTAMIAGNQQASQQAMTLQMSGMKTIMDASLAQANKPSELDRLFEKITPHLPLLKEMIGGTKPDPEAQVKLITALHESQQNSIGMAAQLIEQFANDRIPPEHPGFTIVKQIVESAATAAQAYFAEKGGLGGGPVLPQGTVPAGAIEAGEEEIQEAEVVEAPPKPVAPAPRRAPAPANGTNGANGHAPHPMLAMLPASFKTPQWMQLLEALHSSPPPPVDAMAEVIAFHLQHCMVFQHLPVEISGLQKKPRETLALVFSFLPINASNPKYSAAVQAKVYEMLAANRHVEVEEVEAPKVETKVAPVKPVERARAAPPARVVRTAPKPEPVVVEEEEEPEEDDVSGETETEETSDEPEAQA